MQKGLLIAGLVVFVLLTAGCMSKAGGGGSSIPAPTPVDTGIRVRLETTQGNITLKLYPDMPITAGNFEELGGRASTMELSSTVSSRTL
jgi:hypothetical protein